MISLRLDLDPDSERISGLLGMAGEPGRPFSGWLDLTAALENVRAVVKAGDVASSERVVGAKDRLPHHSTDREELK